MFVSYYCTGIWYSVIVVERAAEGGYWQTFLCVSLTVWPLSLSCLCLGWRERFFICPVTGNNKSKPAHSSFSISSKNSTIEFAYDLRSSRERQWCARAAGSRVPADAVRGPGGPVRVRAARGGRHRRLDRTRRRTLRQGAVDVPGRRRRLGRSQGGRQGKTLTHSTFNSPDCFCRSRFIFGIGRRITNSFCRLDSCTVQTVQYIRASIDAVTCSIWYKKAINV